jgi:hypothetical protein
MSTGRILYWLLTGALIGVGLLAILSVGLPFLVLGLILATFGAIRLGARGLWAALIGFGSLPAAILLRDVTSTAWACEPSGGGTVQPNVSYYSCVDTLVGRLTTYHVLALGFGVVALFGIAWPLFRRLSR